jgi:type II secretory pathway pseudopilin PulG
VVARHGHSEAHPAKIRRAGPPKPTRRPTRAGRLPSHLARPLRSVAGIGIVEVLAAVVVISILLAPVFDAFVRGRMFVAHRGEERMALRLIERKAEQLLQAGYCSTGPDHDVSSINVSAGSHPSDPTIVLHTRGDLCPSNDIVGHLSWNVTETSWTSPGDDVEVKVVDVTLAWPASAPRDAVSVTLLLGK